MIKKFLWCALLFISFGTLTVRAQVTVIKAGKLVEPETGTTSVNQIIIVESGKIKSVGPQLEIPAGASLIDLTHSTVLPGLFDCHTHLLTTWRPSAGLNPTAEGLLPTSLRSIQGVANARGTLEAGFTTSRDVEVAAHCDSNEDARSAIAGGAASIEHGR
ncbi:MAG TPA: hypothetical protein VGO91_04850 [Pyrinomonadaceae bacterium]|nr:hypothetical protein [Pyrinomonadaceae bacterium]